MGRHHGTRPSKAQSIKAPLIQVVRRMNMGLGHSNDDLRARDTAPQPLRGGVNERHAVGPWAQRGARRPGWGRDGTLTSVDFGDLRQQHTKPASENRLPHALGRLRRARDEVQSARGRRHNERA